jgi:hypothetical protein
MERRSIIMEGTTLTKLVLVEGETYRWAIPHCPPGTGIFRGIVSPIGWLAMETWSETVGEGEIVFLNPMVLSSLRPETWPKEIL